MLEKLFPPPIEVVSSDTDLPPTPEMSSGWVSGGSTSILPSLTSDTFCSQHAHFLISLLVSILPPPTGLDTTSGWSLTSFSHFSRQEISTINKVTINFIIPMPQDTGFPSWGNITMTLSLSTHAGLASNYIRQGTHPSHTFLEIQHNRN